MGELFDRVVRVQIAPPSGQARELEGLRMAFKVTRTSTSRADAAEVSIWGLTSSTAGELEDRRTVVRVIAGYRNSGVGQIIAGTVVPGSLRRPSQGAETITTVQVAESSVDLANVVLSDAWGASVTTREIVARVADRLGVSFGQTDLADNVTYARGYVVSGDARTVLSELAQDARSRWTIQNGRLVLIPLSGSVRSRVAILSASTGLVGTPEAADKQQIRIVALLQPSILPGDRIRLQSDRYAGDYVVRGVEHAGDSGYASQYYSTLTCRAVR